MSLPYEIHEDELTELQAEIKRLRAALERIAALYPMRLSGPSAIAREALKQ